jgi:hypothetical protein
VIYTDVLLEFFKAQKVHVECDGAELMLLIASLEMAAGNISDPENIYDLRMKMEDQAKTLVKRIISGSAAPSR